jgi:hypothetical protein
MMTCQRGSETARPLYDEGNLDCQKESPLVYEHREVAIGCRSGGLGLLASFIQEATPTLGTTC